ncbi:hypothetical protein [Streptomyces sp. Ag109_O5-10]|uniref:hypothetical protein n=1 Tax=Streptomyces sp. Ag109_O5-10 TaxID=1855349 RepID=UPI00210A0CA6|nr:hypothetical protein [Streptomyces sp. Ag109_O5-10]
MVCIGYTKPGAQAFIDSWAGQFAGWGLDHLKTDGVVSPDQQDDARGVVVEVRGQDDDRDDQAEDVHGQAPRSRPAPAWPDRGRSWRRGPGGHTGSWMTR